MNAVKVGVLGAGNMGKNHVRLTSEMREFELIGIYDTNPAAESITKVYNTQFYTNLNELLSNVEAVIIATPSSTHIEMAKTAVDNGLHTLVEKPLGLDSNEANIINEAFNKSGKVLCVGHVERFNPVVLEAEKLLEHEDVIAINTRRFSPKDMRINDADVLQDLLIHDLDIIVNSLNKSKIKKLNANGRVAYNDYLVDYVHSIIEFENGVLATLEASRTTEDKVRDIDIHTTNSFIRMDLLGKTMTITRKTNYKLDTGYSPTYRQENITEKVIIPLIEPLKEELKNFAACILSGDTPRVNGDNAYYALKILDEMKELIYR